MTKEIKVQTPKGRAYIHWFGKKAPETIQYYPAQLVEKTQQSSKIDEPSFANLQENWHNLIFHGDNKECLSNLLTNGFRGKVDLIYIDPPFDSGADYVRKVELRGTKNKLEGEEQSLYEQVQYQDIWKNDSYLQFMYERLILLRELLSDEGSIYLHCDWHKSHHLRFLLDEVFGEDNFVNEVVWCYEGPGSPSDIKFASKHDIILRYSKYIKDSIVNDLYYYEKIHKSQVKYDIDENNKYYYTLPKGDYSEINIKKLELENRIYKTKNGTIRIKYFVELEGDFFIKKVKIKDVWNDISSIGLAANSIQNENYPTQKPEALLERIIKASSNENSIVLDCFMGSGTTQAVAQKLGRKWIGIDCNKGSIQTALKRLQKIANAEGLTAKESKILHYKVNNYDFREVNDLSEMVIKKYGLDICNDSYFNFKKGESYCKVIDLHRPLTPLDVEKTIDEALSRQNDEEVFIFASGTQDDAKIDEIKTRHNKMHTSNKIIITDIQKDGMIAFKPAEFEIAITRNGETAEVEIKNYISNQILQKMNVDRNLFTLEINDFKSQIDYVLIDTNYNGEVFTTCLSDVPAKKKDLITGKYRISAQGKIAIKIVDMLGEESLFVE